MSFYFLFLFKSDLKGVLVAEEEEGGIWEEGGDVGTRGTNSVSHFHMFSYKLSKGKLSQFNPILEYNRPRSRVTQECGELCQLRWNNQYFQLIFIHSFTPHWEVFCLERCMGSRLWAQRSLALGCVCWGNRARPRQTLRWIRYPFTFPYFLKFKARPRQTLLWLFHFLA